MAAGFFPHFKLRQGILAGLSFNQFLLDIKLCNRSKDSGTVFVISRSKIMANALFRSFKSS